MKRKHTAALAALTLLIGACGGGEKHPEVIDLKGAGATFPAPAYDAWFRAYSDEKPSLRIAYDRAGSEEGVKRLLAGTVDFAGTVAPLTDQQMAGPKRYLHFPALVGAVVPVYNLPGVSATLNFDANVLSGIFLGRINTWSDPAIAKLNPDVELPSSTIQVIHRSEGAGTTQVLAEYLSTTSPEWREKIGESGTIEWPVGRAVAGNAGVAEAVATTDGSIGYVEHNFAIQRKLPFGAVRNKAGRMVKADFETVAAAIDSTMKTVPADLRIRAGTEIPVERGYPMTSFSFIVVPADIEPNYKAEAMRFFLEWLYSKPGQDVALSLDYNLLTPAMADRVRSQISRIQ